jgi:hypothetical protein
VTFIAANRRAAKFAGNPEMSDAIRTVFVSSDGCFRFPTRSGFLPYALRERPEGNPGLGKGNLNWEEIDRLDRLRSLAMETERRLRDNEGLLSATGMDVPGEIQKLRDELGRIEAQHRRSDEAFERMLQSLADLADARRDLYKALQLLVAAAEKENSLSPEIKRAREVLADLSREMPLN